MEKHKNEIIEIRELERAACLEKLRQMIGSLDQKYEILSQEQIDQIIEISKQGLEGFADDLEISGERINPGKALESFKNAVLSNATDQELEEVLKDKNWLKNIKHAGAIMKELRARPGIFNSYYPDFLAAFDEINQQNDPQRAITTFMHDDYMIKELIKGLEREKAKKLFQKIAQKCKELGTYNCYGKILEQLISYGLGEGEAIEEYGVNLATIEQYNEQSWLSRGDNKDQDQLEIQYSDTRITEEVMQGIKNIQHKELESPPQPLEQQIDLAKIFEAKKRRRRW